MSEEFKALITFFIFLALLMGIGIYLEVKTQQLNQLKQACPHCNPTK